MQGLVVPYRHFQNVIKDSVYGISVKYSIISTDVSKDPKLVLDWVLRKRVPKLNVM